MLAALWAVEDKATMWFMNSFYEHLVHGESASESLHQAMKSMRENRFSEVRQWAPFMLIGDDVTFEGLCLILFVQYIQECLVTVCEAGHGVCVCVCVCQFCTSQYIVLF